jgi:hypothetical protein
MEHTTHELRKKLLEMYPELERYQVKLDLEFKGDKDYWVVKLTKGDHILHTHLEVKDANACLDGVKCIYLGVQVMQFLDNFERLAKR